MANRLDQALDEVIEDRRRERSSGNRRNNDRGRRDNGGGIRKRLGNVHNSSSPTIRSFVRTVNVQNNEKRGRDVNGQWTHDMFDDEDFPIQRSVLSRLGGSKSISDRLGRGVEIKIDNLHYDVTEKDLQDLFATAGEVMKSRIIFDASGRSTGVGYVKYSSMRDAEKAIEKYHKIEFDGQPMSIEVVERKQHHTGSRGSRRDGGRSRGFRERDSRDRGRDSRRPRDSKPKSERRAPVSAEDLDKEMDSYMKSNSNDNNEDMDMLLD